MSVHLVWKFEGQFFRHTSSREKKTRQACIPYLYEKIQDSQRNDHYQKDGGGKTNREHCANDGKEGPEEGGETSGYHVINATYILGKAVHDSPLGGGLKE